VDHHCISLAAYQTSSKSGNEQLELFIEIQQIGCLQIWQNEIP